LYVRRNGELDLSSIAGSGFGYRIEEIDRPLHLPVLSCGEMNGSTTAVGPHFFGAKKPVEHRGHFPS
jgi:hypothetical protein